MSDCECCRATLDFDLLDAVTHDMTTDDPLRQQLARFMDFGEAHATADAAFAELEPALQGKRPHGLPHSPWELLEHIRITQHDILDFCVNPKYEEMQWPR